MELIFGDPWEDPRRPRDNTFAQSDFRSIYFSLRRPIANFQRTKKSHLTSSSDTITRTIFVENYAESPWIFSDIKSPEFFNFIFDI